MMKKSRADQSVRPAFSTNSGRQIQIPGVNQGRHLLDDEQRRQYERDRAQQLDQHVQRRPRRVLERVADRVADDGRGVGGCAFPMTSPSSSFMLPASMNFLALSQAPPVLFKTVASRIPPIVPTIRKPASASALQDQAHTNGRPTARTPGRPSGAARRAW